MSPIVKSKKIEEIFEHLNDCILIDVRSESEYKEDHIPNSINLPVLTDQQRIDVGILYKADSFEARQLGARLIAGNLPNILQKIESMYKTMDIKQKKFILYCWRGGMRSRSLFVVMDLIGYKTYTLDRGYKSYRNYINQYFSSLDNNIKITTIYGPSGTGKTQLIETLIQNNVPCINLEKLANHKGSALGGSFENQPSQKLFETYLFEQLHLSNQTHYIVEGESRKIGKLKLPDLFYGKMLGGEKIWVEIPIEQRAARIVEDYLEPDSFLLSQLEKIRKFIEIDLYNEIHRLLKFGDRSQVAYLLLMHYYDPFYMKNSPEKNSRDYKKTFKTDNFNHLQKDLVDYFQ